MTVACREFAPDRVLLLGPGETLGGAIGHCLVALDWLDVADKSLFLRMQDEDPFLIAMGRPSQRQIVGRLSRIP